MTEELQAAVDLRPYVQPETLQQPNGRRGRFPVLRCSGCGFIWAGVSGEEQDLCVSAFRSGWRIRDGELRCEMCLRMAGQSRSGGV